MSNDNTLLIAALAVGAVVLMNKQTAAAAAAAKPAAAVPQTNNVQNSLWTSLLGTGWTMLKDATKSDGTAAFLEKNFLGQTVTSDGKPVGGELAALFPATYGGFLPVDTTSDGTNYLGSFFNFGEYE